MSKDKRKSQNKALQSILSSHAEQVTSAPTDIKDIVDEKLLEEILGAGLAFQFEDSPQKIKQNIRMQIKARIRKVENNDS